MVRTNGRTTKPRKNPIEEKDELQDEVGLKFDIDPELLAGLKQISSPNKA
jgi:hypothetical protein